MALDKREIRQAVAHLVGDLGVTGYVTTTAAGASSGLTFVTTQHLGYGADSTRNLWALPTSGAEEGKHREIDDFVSGTPASSSTSTIKGAAWSGALASGVTIELYKYNPSLYTIAINNAIMSSYPWIYNPVWDRSISLTADDFRYTLPSGITPEMITKMMVEGVSPYASQPDPDSNITNFVYSPDNAEILFNMRDPNRKINFTTGRKLEIFARKYLTALAADTQSAIVTDTTDFVELTKTTRYWRLFLIACKKEMFGLLAGTAANPERDHHAKMYKEAVEEFDKNKSTLAMPPMASTYGGW